jgi:hypothetical protein
MKSKNGGVNKGPKDFVDIFGVNDSDGDEYGEEERDLSKGERDLLAEFEENDKELEDIAGQIVNALDMVKGTAE